MMTLFITVKIGPTGVEANAGVEGDESSTKEEARLAAIVAAATHLMYKDIVDNIAFLTDEQRNKAKELSKTYIGMWNSGIADFVNHKLKNSGRAN